MDILCGDLVQDALHLISGILPAVNAALIYLRTLFIKVSLANKLMLGAVYYSLSGL